jgi:hypothetical protein
MKPHLLPLACRVIDGVATISIGVNMLCFAVKVGLKSEGQWPKEIGAITFPEGFAKEMWNAINNERKDGSTRLTDLLEWAALEAIDNGSQYVNLLHNGKIIEKGDTK